MNIAEKPSGSSPPPRPIRSPARVHWSTAFTEVLAAHTWREQALDAFVSHSFTGHPDTERWCTRCTLMLPADWKDPKKPVPPLCGDPRIVPQMAVYEYVDGNPVHGVQLADPNYAGAKVKDG